MHRVALVTGANSNLGINICYRLLETVPTDDRLTIIVTSRSLPRVNEVIQLIKKYNLEKVHRKGILDFDYVLVDFTNMVSIVAAYYELEKKFTKIDYLFVCAAQGVYSGIDWLKATKEVLSNPLEAVTNPTYKIQRVGVKSKDGLGLVFQANVFGPFYFIHKIIKLLENGRIVLISSVMSDSKYLSFNDLQLLKTDASYEGSKRILDLLHLATYKKLKEKYNITQYLVHPGIFTSFGFYQYLNFFTYYGMLFLFYLARLLGSPWHNISGYIAANSCIFTAIAADPEINDQKLKYGSACTVSGEEYIKRLEINDPTGAADIENYFDKLASEWDEKLINQINITRKS